MRSPRLPGLALLAVLSASALLAPTASAGLPLLLPSTKQKFDSTSGLGILTSEAGETIDCTSSAGEGEITGSETIGHLVVTFHGCTAAANAGEKPCTIKSTNTTSEGLIVTKTLVGHLGTTKEAKNGVALLIEPETTKKVLVLAKATCIEESLFTGSVAAEFVTTSKGATHTAKLNFEAAAVGSPHAKITKVDGREVELEWAAKSTSEETEDEFTFLTANVEVC